MDDLISRQAAIDALADTECYEWEEEPGKFFEWDDLEKMLRELPTAQPEIIMCKDCRHYVAEDYNCLQMDTGGWMYYPDDFCSLAERREDDNK